MLLIDVGNTTLHFVREKQGKFFNDGRFFTKQTNIAAVKRIISKYGENKIIVCSVVPSVTEIFKKLKVYYGKKIVILIVGQDLNIPMKSLYNKKNIGGDRLVCAFAARNFYPKARIVIDFGTAITFDFLSDKGVYQGGIILPGIGSTLRVFSSCALLPNKINLKKLNNFVNLGKNCPPPRNTKNSINRGIQEGFSLMINALVEKYVKNLKLPSKNSVVLTGGDAKLIQPALTFPYISEPHLVFKGLFLLAEEKGDRLLF